MDCLKLNACIKHWKTPIVIVLFLCVAIGLVVVWHCYDPELAKFLGYLIGGVLITWQIYVASRRAAAAEKTAKLTENGNIAERFKNAIEHLGNCSAAVNLGGIYALHHIAHEVEEYRERVFKILCSYIRGITTSPKYRSRNAGSTEIKPTIEIQSILNLLFTDTQDRKIYKGLQGNLEGADLYGARFASANLQNANLRGANLQKANLRYAKLQNADLWKANLQEANLRRANLQKAKLREAKLQNADLRGGNLQNANLWIADLQDAVLRFAKLQNADLLRAKLQNADLLRAKLQNASLWRAELQNADLYQANLQEANLRGANLQEANLLEADLQNANLENTNFQKANLTDVKNLKAEQLLKAKTLYEAKLPAWMKEEIMQENSKLFDPPDA